MTEQCYSLGKVSEALGLSQATHCARKQTLAPRKQTNLEAESPHLAELAGKMPA